MGLRLTANKDEVKGMPLMQEGMVTVRLDGFKPSLSKNKDSVNLNPIMKVINHAEYNDRSVFENLNTKGKWVWTDFCHAFGVPMVADASGDFEFPGQWGEGVNEADSSTWQYSGPLLGQQAQLYIIQGDNGKGGVNNKVKYYVCKIAGCVDKHSSNLAK
jgi:hypothetical protein